MTEISKAQSSIWSLANEGIVIRKEEERSEGFVVKVPRSTWRVVVSDDLQIERVFPQAAATVRPKFKLCKLCANK